MKLKKGEFELFRCIQSGMILQREETIKIWGFALQGETLRLSFMGKEYETVADENNIFEFEVKTGEAGGPYTMKISSSDMSETVEDILFGDVYYINGQSNMEFTINGTLDALKEEIDTINFPEIREFRVPIEFEFNGQRQQYSDGFWYKATKDDIYDMSAVGFHFAKNVHVNEHIPVGLINTAVGGTPIEAHLPEELLREYKIYDEDIEKCKDSSYVEQVQKSELEYMDDWFKTLDESDVGMDGEKPVFAAPDYDDEDWKTLSIPGRLSGDDFNEYHGSVWLRREFEIPKGAKLEGALLRLGTIIDADVTYINGIKVGNTEYCYPARRYFIPDGTLKYGKNVICVRMFIFREMARFVEGKRYCIQGDSYIYEGGHTGIAAMPEDADPENGRWEINLAGEWRYRLGAYMPRMKEQTFFTYKPAAIYNAMISPLMRTSFKGALWYQGETNTYNADMYGGFLKQLIACYREWFGEKLPFLCVQLPQYHDPIELYEDLSWAQVREAQRDALLLPYTALCVTIDAGESNDLHPQTKALVGYRLYLVAKALIYGQDNEYMGPEVENVELTDDNQIRISFSHCDGGIVLKNNTCFEVCKKLEGDVWVAADDVVKTEDNVLTVKSKKVESSEHICGVRYCYCNNPIEPSIYNVAGLPASPFIITI